ncbi:MAG: hypothetical protein ACI38A_07945, partial [Candidatus Ornithomonoglobus sp.]
MKRKLISLVVGAAMLLSSVPNVLTAGAADGITVLNDTFDDGNLAGYEVYDTGAGTNPQVKVEDGALKFDEASGWDSHNGIKKDITGALSDAGFTSGGTLNISVDVSSSWYDNPATVFIEANGVKTTLASGGPGGQTWTKVTLTGSAAVSFNASDTVYLCINQPCGTHLYDNISLTYTGGGEPAQPTQTQTAEPKDSALFSYSGEDFKDDAVMSRFTVYDTSDTGAQKSADGTGLILSTMTSAENQNGFRMDITDFVKTAGSGYKYTASLDTLSTWWQENDGKLFFEIVKNGAVTEKVLEEKAGTDTDTQYHFEGADFLEFDENAEIYLCYIQLAGYQKYDNITLSYDKTVKTTEPPETTTAPAATEPAQTDGTLFSYSGDDFKDDAVMSRFTVYDTTDTGAQKSADGTGLILSTMTSTENQNGFRMDITDFVKTSGSGYKYTASLDTLSTWWQENKGKLFFEIVKNGTVTEKVLEEKAGTDTSVIYSFEGADFLEFDENAEIYLCYIQLAGYQKYDNITLSYDKTVKTTEPPETTTAPAATEPARTDGTLFSYSDNDFKDDAVMSRFTVYDTADAGAQKSADGTGLILSNMTSSSNKNGFRMDITDFVKAAGSGYKYTASLDTRSTWWQENKGKLFFEIVKNGTVTEKVLEEKAETDTSVIYSFEGAEFLHFDDDTRVNLCYIQLAGYQKYNNITLSCDKSVQATAEPQATRSPEETEAPTAAPKPTANPNAFIYDDFSSISVTDKYDIYSAFNTGDSLSIDNQQLRYTAGSNWNADNGIRRDVTEEFAAYESGTNFEVYLDITAWWGESSYANPATVFFEVISENGAVTKTQIASGPSADLPYGGESSYLSGSAQLSYKSTDRLYLCITQPSGNHVYDNISVAAVSPYPEGIVQLSSGKINSGEFMPENSKSIYIDTFSSEEDIEKYSAYGTEFKEAPSMSEGAASFSFNSDWSADNGVSVNITEAMRAGYTGGQFKVSFDFLTYYWGGSTAVASLKYGNDVKGWKSYDAASGSGTETGVFYP